LGVLGGRKNNRKRTFESCKGRTNKGGALKKRIVLNAAKPLFGSPKRGKRKMGWMEFHGEVKQTKGALTSFGTLAKKVGKKVSTGLKPKKARGEDPKKQKQSQGIRQGTIANEEKKHAM